MPSHRSIARLLATLVVVGLAITACSDDGDDAAEGGSAGGAEAASPSGSASEYCDAALAIELQPEPNIDFESADPEEIAATLQQYAGELAPFVADALAAAPDEIVDDGETVEAARAQLADTGDPSAFEDEEVVAATERIHEFDVEECGWQTIDVTAREYQFDGVPTTLSTGTTSFEFSNEGDELHHLVMVRINDGVTMPVEEILELDQEEALEYVSMVGNEPLAFPGDSTYTVADLEPGKYVAVCFIPVGETGDGPPTEGPPHFTQGMVAEFEVQ